MIGWSYGCFGPSVNSESDHLDSPISSILFKTPPISPWHPHHPVQLLQQQLRAQASAGVSEHRHAGIRRLRPNPQHE